MKLNLYFLLFLLLNLAIPSFAQSENASPNAHVAQIPDRAASTTSWGQYKQEFKKTYSNPNEDLYRAFVFEKNKQKINAHNAKAKSNRKYNLKLN